MSLSNFKPLLYIVLLYLFLKYLFVFLSPFICAYTFARLLYEIKSQRAFSFIIYFILLFILLIVFISFLYLFYKQTKTIYFELPQLIEHLSTTLYSFPLLNHYQSTIISLLNQIFPFISSLLIKLPQFLSFIIFTFILTYLFLLDVHVLGKILYHLSYKTYAQAQKIQSIILTTLFHLIKSTFILFLITWLECYIGLLYLKNTQAFIFSFIIACFDSMPLIGIGFILIPTSIIMFINQNQSALAYLLLYIIITLLRFFIEPKLVSKQLNISLLYYLFMMYICAKAFGFLGFFYAPLFCVFSLLWYNKNKTSHDSLGEQT